MADRKWQIHHEKFMQQVEDYATMNIHTDICSGGVTVKISATYSLQAMNLGLFLSYIITAELSK